MCTQTPYQRFVNFGERASESCVLTVSQEVVSLVFHCPARRTKESKYLVSLFSRCSAVCQRLLGLLVTVDCGSATQPPGLPCQDCSRVVLVMENVIKIFLSACAVLCCRHTLMLVDFAVLGMSSVRPSQKLKGTNKAE